MLLEGYIRRRSHECDLFAEYERRIVRAASARPSMEAAAVAAGSARSAELGTRVQSALDQMTAAVAAEEQLSSLVECGGMDEPKAAQVSVEAGTDNRDKGTDNRD